MIKQPDKNKTLNNLANVNDTQTDVTRAAAIFTITRNGTIQKTNKGIFLLNPDSINESKSANWVAHQTPGQSDPVLQWLSSGPRTLSFTALVTADTSDFVQTAVKPAAPQKEDPTTLNKIFGGIAASFAKVKAPPPLREIPGSDVFKADTLDISNYLDYYRSLLYPEYDTVNNPRRLVQSPPLVVLFMGNAINKLPFEAKVSDQHDMWVITNLGIKVTKFLPNLAPMEAEVSFQLTQYNVRSFDRRRFIKE